MTDRSRTFLLEAYVPSTGAGGPAAAAARARSAVKQMRNEGKAIRLVRSFFLPEDEICFCLYQAYSLDDVGEAGHRARLAGRIQRVVELSEC